MKVTQLSKYIEWNNSTALESNWHCISFMGNFSELSLGVKNQNVP